MVISCSPLRPFLHQQINVTFSMSVHYNTNSSFLRSFSFATDLFSSLIKILSVSKHNFFIVKFHCFMFLLNFITSKNSFFFITYKYSYLGMVPVLNMPNMQSKYAQFLISFLKNLLYCFLSLSTALSLSLSFSVPVLIVLRTLANLLEQFLKSLQFLLFFFSISNNNILYHFS